MEKLLKSIYYSKGHLKSGDYHYQPKDLIGGKTVALSIKADFLTHNLRCQSSLNQQSQIDSIWLFMASLMFWAVLSLKFWIGKFTDSLIELGHILLLLQDHTRNRSSLKIIVNCAFAMSLTKSSLSFENQSTRFFFNFMF